VRLRLPSHRVWVTYVLLGLLAVVFLAQLAFDQLGLRDLVLALGAKENTLIAHGEYWRLLTAVFIHASLLHFGFNAYALYNLGREVERFSGPVRMALIFLFSGLSGTVFSLIFNPSPSVGASGAIFGLIGAMGVFLYRHRRILGDGGRRALQNLILIALVNFAIGLQGRIDNWAHLGGLLGGVALCWVIGPYWELRPDPAAGGVAASAYDRQPLAGARWAAVLMLWAALILLAGLGVALASRASS
jgi:rhomboid protease GluP